MVSTTDLFNSGWRLSGVWIPTDHADRVGIRYGCTFGSLFRWWGEGLAMRNCNLGRIRWDFTGMGTFDDMILLFYVLSTCQHVLVTCPWSARYIHVCMYIYIYIERESLEYIFEIKSFYLMHICELKHAGWKSLRGDGCGCWRHPGQRNFWIIIFLMPYIAI